MSRILGDNWVLPGLDDLSRPYFTSGALTLQRCTACKNIQHPPEQVCIKCQSFKLESFKSKGEGTIESVSVAHHPVHPALKDAVPYAMVLVSVADAPGVLIAGNVTGGAPETLKIGDKVRCVIEEVTDPNGQKLTIPQWERAK